MKKILLIDDEKMMCDILKKVLCRHKYQVLVSYSAEEGWDMFVKHQPEFLIIDYQLPKKNGLDLLEDIRKIHNTTPAIIITAHGTVPNAVRAMKLQAIDFLQKPFNNEDLIKLIKKTINIPCKNNSISSHSKINNNLLKDSLIGESSVMSNVLNDLLLVAASNVNVIVEGDTGTGKELFAKVIHDQSKRYKNDFIPIDCGAIPSHLFESELFGHRKGAFTDASYERKGKFEEAQYGTIFFDEINNLPLDMQAKLLRAIENKMICKVGTNKYKSVDTRILAASNRNIEQDVRDGKFRKDLYYRLNEFKINIPPLCERRDDIPLLANYFLKKLNITLEMEILNFSVKAIDKLMAYDWPGNVRELKNVITHAMLRATSTMIKRNDIHFSSLEIKEGYKGYSLAKITEDAEKKAIVNAINIANGNKSIAADLLEISRRQLYRKMIKYGLDVTH